MGDFAPRRPPGPVLAHSHGTTRRNSSPLQAVPSDLEWDGKIPGTQEHQRSPTTKQGRGGRPGTSGQPPSPANLDDGRASYPPQMNTSAPNQGRAHPTPHVSVK